MAQLLELHVLYISIFIAILYSSRILSIDHEDTSHNKKPKSYLLYVAPRNSENFPRILTTYFDIVVSPLLFKPWRTERALFALIYARISECAHIVPRANRAIFMGDVWESLFAFESPFFLEGVLWDSAPWFFMPFTARSRRACKHGKKWVNYQSICPNHRDKSCPHSQGWDGGTSRGCVVASVKFTLWTNRYALIATFWE